VRTSGGALVGLIIALVMSPAAGAWTKVSAGNLDNTVDPSVILLRSGLQAVAYREPKAHAVVVIVGGKAKTVASGLAAVGDPGLVQLPNGTLDLFVADQDGVVSYTSSNGGATWSGPAKTASKDTGDVQAAAVRADGTPLFTQDGTGFLNVFQGAGGESVHNVFAHCCGYAESLAVDTHGLAQIAFWSNATGKAGYLYGKLGPTGSLARLRTISQGETVSRDNRVPLVADRKGNTFVSLANGYPTSSSFVVDTMRSGTTAHAVTLAKGSFSGNEPLMALGVDSANRLWAVWTQGGSVWAARSRSDGAHFGAAVHVREPGSAYQLEAAASADGSVDAIVNTGSSLQSQRLLPGLTVQGITHGVRVLDDGFTVVGATVRGGGKTVKTGASGTAVLGNVPSHTSVAVTAAGYAPTSGATA
jgi:hypothetical protein